jgi:hypothetical protein
LNRALAGILVTIVAFFAAGAVLDFTVIHGGFNWSGSSDILYKYWISLGILVTAFAFAVTYIAWTFGMPTRQAIALFLTVWLLFIAGLMDYFFALFAYLRGEHYSFNDVWSAQYKIFVANGLLPEWTWTHQALWALGCLIIIILVWRWALR